MKESNPESPASASTRECVTAGLRRSSKCTFHHPIMSPVELHTRSPHSEQLEKQNEAKNMQHQTEDPEEKVLGPLCFFSRRGEGGGGEGVVTKAAAAFSSSSFKNREKNDIMAFMLRRRNTVCFPLGTPTKLAFSKDAELSSLVSIGKNRICSQWLSSVSDMKKSATAYLRVPAVHKREG
ncbi:hypothetical protein ATANTOWER_031506 [Ataeniobius toweri]|uniref:Uncharacterized protein n=1 Tax=Ataeniobius toweri TaxID=208326 RepID=A0ABU7AUQ7_9TELE|nr:hypothetical protein [Ataeniobius toweri]